MGLDLSSILKTASEIARRNQERRDKFTDEQREALDRISDWFYDSDEQVFKLTGLAGTGKTYLLSHLEEELNCDILYLAYTGKASNNLSKKGLNSKTIHSVLYQPIKDLPEPSPALLTSIIQELNLKCSMDSCKYRLMEAFGYTSAEKVLKFIKKDKEDQEEEVLPSLIVIDEASMVSRVIYTDLLELGVKVLLCGDPGQLPPIETDQTWLPLADPDFTLTDIQRQEQDNPIIQIAHSIYHWNLDGIQYNTPLASDSGSILLLNKGYSDKSIEALLLKADQVICYTNKYRIWLNGVMRKLRGFADPFPQPGDKLVCTKNNWKKITDDVPLVNGQIGECVAFELKEKTCNKKKYRIGVLTFRPDYTDSVLTVQISPNPFIANDEEKIPEDAVDEMKLNKFEFGYAITVHKAQGSEWDNVVAVYDSSVTFGNLKEWLYTALTRARQQILLYLPKVSCIDHIRKITKK